MKEGVGELPEESEARAEGNARGSHTAQGGKHVVSLVPAEGPGETRPRSRLCPQLTAFCDPEGPQCGDAPQAPLTFPPALASACERGDPSRWSWSSSSSTSSRTSPDWLSTCQEAEDKEELA